MSDGRLNCFLAPIVKYLMLIDGSFVFQKTQRSHALTLFVGWLVSGLAL